MVLTAAVCAVVAGSRSYTAIGEWVADLPAATALLLGIDTDRRSSEAMTRRLLQAVDPELLAAAIGTWLATRIPSPAPGTRPAIAVDGKTIRGPSRRDGDDDHDGNGSNGGNNGSPANNDSGVPGSDKNADKPKHDRTDTEDTKDPEPTGGKCNGHSFDPDTKVLMADGTAKAIKDIRIGDEVLATDPETGKTRAEVVEDLHRNLYKEFATLEVVNGEGAKATLQTTANHPFWNESLEQWQPAGDLASGDQLVEPDGSTVSVDTSVVWTGAKYMHDLTVAQTHTYHVLAGNDPVLVHNCGDSADPTHRTSCTCSAGGRPRGHNGWYLPVPGEGRPGPMPCAVPHGGPSTTTQLGAVSVGACADSSPGLARSHADRSMDRSDGNNGTFS